jgi:hypothetical protein
MNISETEKKLIDACKDQAAKEFSEKPNPYKRILVEHGNGAMKDKIIDAVIDRAMQLYGEQCRKEGYDQGQSEMQYHQESNDSV